MAKVMSRSCPGHVPVLPRRCPIDSALRLALSILQAGVLGLKRFEARSGGISGGLQPREPHLQPVRLLRRRLSQGPLLQLLQRHHRVRQRRLADAKMGEPHLLGHGRPALALVELVRKYRVLHTCGGSCLRQLHRMI
eukprot:CAMPEP_0119368220 /NCGR_PEP_ID=MMETSP1334-20130426/14903_1 /TAXON_ID=127549 /ORGANISM="Calcidiscus leptoporus, Strain RCC1130" /LENGTH=136 /DNA_ID=CAMNT_0007384821 /DNA_START=291 /DNA_END=701 /DNA_ORIENTATION=-